jgi:hypothetical protein
VKTSLSIALGLLLLTTAIPAFAKGPTAEEAEALFQKAKALCPQMTNWQQGEEIRACIAAKKEALLMDNDPRVKNSCSKYTGKERSSCVHSVYSTGDSYWTPQRGQLQDKQWQRTQEEIKLPPADPAVVDAGKRHMEIERQNIERAKQNDPRSRESTITGPITTPTLPNPGKTVTISRPPSLGGGGVVPPTKPTPGAVPSNVTGDGQRVGGVSTRGTTTTKQGQLDVAGEAEKLAPPEKKSVPDLPRPAPKAKETN